MRSSTRGLGFRLTAVTYLVVAGFLSVAGFTVYRISRDAIKMGAMEMVRDMSESVKLDTVLNRPIDELGDTIVMLKTKKTGSAWIMDSEGYMLYNPDPLFREEYIKQKKKFGNVMVKLQYASPRPSGTGVFKEKLVDIAAKYSEGFGTYSQFGEQRILAFKALPGHGLLIGVDEPVATANSELERVKKYFSYTAVMSAILIMVFNYLSIRIIIRPYYQDMEDLNASLHRSNSQLGDTNARLAVSNKNLTALHEIGLAMQQSLTLKDILNMIISGIHDVLGAERINIMLPSADGSFLECRAAIGNDDEPLESIRVPVGGQGGALAAAFERKETIRFDEEMTIPQSMKLSSPYDGSAFLRSRAFVVVPLVVKDRAVGIIGLDNKTSRRPITDSQISLLGIFANQAAVAVENARLYDQLRQKIDELDSKVDQLSILHQIGNSMQRVTSLGEALGFIMRGIREGMGFEEVMVCLVNNEEDILQGESGLGVPEEAVGGLRIPLFEEENMLVMSAAGKRPVFLVHFSGEDLISVVKSPLKEGEYREGIKIDLPESRMAVICVPLVAREEIVGVMVVSRKEDPVVRRNDVEMLMLYANTAGLTVERADLYNTMNKDLESLEITDHVSRLFTYRYGQQRVQEMIARSRDTGESLSLLFMGIDDFKEYNDRCGHETGDRSLAAIGAIVKAGIGGENFAYRYGGRIIVAVLPGCDEKQAVAVADRIQERMRAHRFAGPSGESDQVLSLSIGVMEKRGEDEIASEDDLFKGLLALLHRAEAEGGDRILSS